MAEHFDELLQRMRHELFVLRRRANAHDVEPRQVLNEALRELTASVDELEASADAVGLQRDERRLAHQQHSRDLFDAAPDAYVVTDRNGVVEDINQTARELLGADVHDLVREPLAALVADEDHRMLWQAIRRGRDGADRGPWRLTIVPHRGEAFPASLTVGWGREGRRLYWSVRDVTSEERRAGEFQRVLDERRRTEDARQAFFLAMAHDLRSPVNGILAAVRALEARRHELSEEALSGLASITANAESLRRIQTQLVDLERLGREAVRLHRRRTDVSEAVEQAVKAVDLGDRSLETGLDHVEADVDAGLVESIVRNLLENAARHTPPLTRVWVRLESEGDERLLLAVEDDGPGVPPDHREAVFEMFARIDPDDGSGGMGAGLYLVRRFAELHGGRAWVEDREGGGASFRVTLPT